MEQAGSHESAGAAGLEQSNKSLAITARRMDAFPANTRPGGARAWVRAILVVTPLSSRNTKRSAGMSLICWLRDRLGRPLGGSHEIT
jgi:hypothetical protein